MDLLQCRLFKLHWQLSLGSEREVQKLLNFVCCGVKNAELVPFISRTIPYSDPLHRNRTKVVHEQYRTSPLACLNSSRPPKHFRFESYLASERLELFL